jgi:small subunit ribosomal protein S13
MLIIFGKKISSNKKIRYALKEVFGIGISTANNICNILSISHNTKTFDLTEQQKIDISSYLKEHFLLDAMLKTQIQTNIQRYIAINSVRGFRHRSKLPVRGQRTHSNGRTRKRSIN